MFFVIGVAVVTVDIMCTVEDGSRCEYVMRSLSDTSIDSVEDWQSEAFFAASL